MTLQPLQDYPFSYGGTAVPRALIPVTFKPIAGVFTNRLDSNPPRSLDQDGTGLQDDSGVGAGFRPNQWVWEGGVVGGTILFTEIPNRTTVATSKVKRLDIITGTVTTLLDFAAIVGETCDLGGIFRDPSTGLYYIGVSPLSAINTGGDKFVYEWDGVATVSAHRLGNYRPEDLIAPGDGLVYVTSSSEGFGQPTGYLATFSISGLADWEPSRVVIDTSSLFDGFTWMSLQQGRLWYFSSDTGGPRSLTFPGLLFPASSTLFDGGHLVTDNVATCEALLGAERNLLGNLDQNSELRIATSRADGTFAPMNSLQVGSERIVAQTFRFVSAATWFTRITAVLFPTGDLILLHGGTTGRAFNFNDSQTIRFWGASRLIPGSRVDDVAPG